MSNTTILPQNYVFCLIFFLFSLIFDCFYDCSLFETIQAFALGILIIAIHRFIQYSKTRRGIFLNRQLWYSVHSFTLADGHTGIQIEIQPSNQTRRRKTTRQANRNAGRQTSRQAVKQADRQTNVLSLPYFHTRCADPRVTIDIHTKLLTLPSALYLTRRVDPLKSQETSTTSRNNIHFTTEKYIHNDDKNRHIIPISIEKK